MRRTIEETNRRRSIQTAYNEEHGITPRTVSKTREEILAQKSILDVRGGQSTAYIEPYEISVAADPILGYMSREQLEKSIADSEKKMKAAAKELDFIAAAQYRDEVFALRKQWKEKWG